jgi:hypothetical protein
MKVDEKGASLGLWEEKVANSFIKPYIPLPIF